MSISSMTGFAVARGQEEDCSWTWEVKSVNGKGRDIRCRLPSGFDGLDMGSRERAARRFRRGNIVLQLMIKRKPGTGGFGVNREVLDRVLSLLPDIRKRVPEAAPPAIDGLLALPGVIEAVAEDPSAEDRQALEDALQTGLEEALDSLVAARAGEGARLAVVLDGQLDQIEALCREIGSQAAAQPEAIRERLRSQVAELLEAVPALAEERLAQEAALLMTKADVREELDRLEAHLEAARGLMKEDEPIGRRLDFLCQEFNREANTLCAKSADMALTRLGLDLKAAIEQFREQVQNIE